MSQVITVDASGLSCPQPVLLTKKALAQTAQGTVVVLVDSGTSRDNVSRTAVKAGWAVAVEDRPEGGFKLVLTK